MTIYISLPYNCNKPFGSNTLKKHTIIPMGDILDQDNTRTEVTRHSWMRVYQYRIQG